MGKGQCWSIQGNGSRCVAAAQPGSFFCDRHQHARLTEPPRIWFAPETEMPRELVSALRRANPAIIFPATAPGSSREVVGGAAALETIPAPSTPPAVPAGSGGSLSPETSGAPLDWLLLVLRAATEGVMAGEATPLQKANAVSRLAGQYLKAYGAQEREKENKALRRSLADAETQVAALQARVAALEASLVAERVPARPAADVSSRESRAADERPGSIRLRDEEWVSLHEGERPAPRAAAIEVSSLASLVTEGAGVPP